MLDPLEVPDEVREAALALHAWMKSRADWYPLFTLLGDLVEGRDMRPLILRHPHRDIWQMYFESRSPRAVNVPDAVKKLYQQWEP